MGSARRRSPAEPRRGSRSSVPGRPAAGLRASTAGAGRGNRRSTVRRMVRVPFLLSFDIVHEYMAAARDITVPVQLELGRHRIRLHAKLDTGASNCIFQRDYGELLGLDVETGAHMEFGTATGSFVAYGHRVSLSAL